MEKYKFIGIKSAVITGVKKPKLTILGTVTKRDYKFKVYADSKEVNCDYLSLGELTSFGIVVILPQDVKNIEVYLVTEGKEFLVYNGTTSFLKRLLKKLINTIKNFFKKIGHVFYVFYKGFKFLWKEYHFLVPLSLWPKYYHDLKLSLKRGSNNLYNPLNQDDYQKWLDMNMEKVEYEKLEYEPLVSILTPVYNVPKNLLLDTADSVKKQIYPNFEWCLVDDCSTNKETKETLELIAKMDERFHLKYRKENGHISKASNDALKMAKGEFIVLLDHDDMLSPDALYQMVKKINEDKKLDFIYSDEDKINTHGKYCEPHFKPDFSPDTLLSLNYICHLAFIRKNLVEKVGGFALGLEGAQDYDLFLKITEKTKRIAHIPKILYHWRMSENSTALSIKAKDYAIATGKKVLEQALIRRKIDGKVLVDDKSGYYIIKYTLKKEPLVSIIIPTRDYVDILKKCIDSIYRKTIYKNFEIIVANNDSKEKETLDFFEDYKRKYKNFKVVDCIMNFNYSRINNIAESKAKGEYILLLNNDTEVISPDWLNNMVGYASREHIGVVGAKLLYEDGTIQHAGVLLGLGGVASHAFINAREDEIGIYGRLRVPYNYSANTAACFMIRKEIYDKVNGLNEKLEVAYNDIDFCIRVLQAGYYNVFLPQVKLIHYESKSRGLDTTSEKYKRFLEESKYMYDNFNQIIENDPFYNPNFSKKGWFMLDKNKER